VTTALGMAVAALPLVIVAAALVLIGVAVVRSLRDEAVVDGLRAEVRSIGEVQRAVHEARTSATSRTTLR
jgi:hypothetical protein